MTFRLSRLSCVVVSFAVALFAPRVARANVGTPDFNNWSWVDSKGTSGPRVFPRYVTVPVLGAGATGNGTINHPTLPAQLWDYNTGAVKIPLETFTLTATSATTFTVAGTVTGALADATVGVSYTTPAGMNFTIAAGSTPFAVGDKLTFSIVDHYSVENLPGATSYQVAKNGFVVLPASPFTLRSEGVTAANPVVVYAAGYITQTGNNTPKLMTHFALPQNDNTTLPARTITVYQAGTVMPFWDALVPKTTSKVWVATVGRAGSRAFIVEYNDFAHADDPNASFTFQVMWFEGLSRVRFHYVTMTGAHADGSSATIGTQGRLSQRYTANGYSVNTASVVAGLAIELGSDGDRDRLPDGIEQQYGTNTGTRFTDGGSPALSDSAQLIAGLNPTTNTDNATVTTDTDGDTILDIEETAIGTNPNAMDTDGDGLNDNVEINAGNNTDPLTADTDGDGRSDGQEDANASGNVDGTETNPNSWDTDDDGVSDGTEIAQATDPLVNTSGRISLPIGLATINYSYYVASALDSKGNLHVSWTNNGGNSPNNTPDDMQVALLTPTGSVYATSVDGTTITSHTGMDDRTTTIVTAPGTGAVDRTFVINNSRTGYAFLTEIDFNLAARDGTASTSATIVKSTRMLPFSVAVDHPVAKVAGGKIHLVFQGQELLGAEQFAHTQMVRGTYYAQLDLDGNVLVQPTLMWQRPAVGHHHNYPRIAVDGMGNIHSVVRGGSCRWSQGPADCALYYTKLSSTGTPLVPTTKLQLEGNGGFHRSPEIAISPNGLVNIVYTTNAPVISGNNNGGYEVGSEVRLYSFAVINNQIVTVINQKPLRSYVPDRSKGAVNSVTVNAYRTPSLRIDAGGNLHLFVVEDNNTSDGEYVAFTPNGDPKVGPYFVRNAYYWGNDGIELNGNTVLIAYRNNITGSRAAFRQIDITGSGLDLSGNSQVPLPTAETLAITSVTPSVVGVGTKTVITVTGTGIAPGAKIAVGGVDVTNVQAFDASSFVGLFDATTLAEGAYDVVVQNPDGAMATASGAVTVSAGPVEPQPEPEPSEDDGCCNVGGKSPVGSLFLAALVLVGLARKRRRAGIAALVAVVGLSSLAPRTAHAGLGTPDQFGWSWVDNKGTTGPRVIARYVTTPVKSATSVGNGTIDYPTLPTQLWSYTNNAPRIPLETFTLTATSATTFTVVGSVSGALADATVGTPYTTAAGMNFTITAGGTAFAAGDKFDFAIVDHVSASAIPNAVSRTIPSYGHLLVQTPMPVATEANSGPGTLVVYDAGYLAFTTTGNPSLLRDFYPRLLPNTALPARLLANPNSVAIFPFWDELIQKPTSRIWTAMFGRTGERVFVVEYNDFAHASDMTASYTFQVVFFENGPKLRFHYISMQNGTGTSANGSTASIGVQPFLRDDFGAVGYSFNGATVTDGLVIELGSDADRDRLPYGIEQQYGTNENVQATDGGSPSLSDSAQLLASLDPTSSTDNATVTTDTDADTILDIEEVARGTNPNAKDTDGDGIDDNLETSTNPLVADTDGDGRTDGEEDADKDGAVDAGETNPTVWDSDSDGVSDGTEVAQATDPLDAASGRMAPVVQLAAAGTTYFIQSALDSKGNLHVVWVRNRSDNSTPDEMYVALLKATGGVYAVEVAETLITSHTGLDDRAATIVTVPGTGAIDRTLIVNNTDRGFAFLTEVDFNAAAGGGAASDTATIVKATRMLPLSVAVDHPMMKVSGDKLAVVFQGQETLGTARFAKNQAARGSYYMQLDLNGDVLVQPTLMFQKGVPAHHHGHPSIAVDGMGNIHSVVRGGTCRYEQGPSDCAFYYTKLTSAGAVVVPTTKLQLEGNGGLHRYASIQISPNGLVNLIYTTTAPIISGNNVGGFDIGNEVRLYSFSTLNNQITTVINQKTLLSSKPELAQFPFDALRLPTWRTPTTAMDAGGNIHLFVANDQGNIGQGNYYAFAPNGDRKVGPYQLPAYAWGTDALQLSGDHVLFTYKSASRAAVRQLDITGSGLDLSGNSQVAVPGAETLVLSRVSPDSVPVGTGKVTVTITGSGFVGGTLATINGMPVTRALTFDAGNIIGEFDATGLAEGAYDVAVQNPNGAMVTLPGGFYVGERPGPEPEPEPTPTDDGCCNVGGKSPVGSLLLAGLVAGALVGSRRRRRR